LPAPDPSRPRLLSALAGFCHVRGGIVAAGALLLTALCLQFILTHTAVSTDFNALLSDKLPFAKNQALLEQAFPRHNDTVILVIDGDTADLAEYTVHAMTAWLSRHPGVADHFSERGGSAFFRKNGLLYLSPEDLEDVAGRLAGMQPVLARLAMNTTLPGLAGLIGDALGPDGSGMADQRATLVRLFEAWRSAMRAVEQHRFFVFPWREIMAGDASVLAARRRMIEVTPHTDHDAIQPAAGSIESIRQAITALGLTPAHGIRIRLTGSAMLDYVQLEGAMQAAGLATLLASALILVLLFAALRNARMVLAITLTLAMSLIWTAAFALYATAPLNVISISFAVLFVGMGVDFGIQFGMHCRREAGKGRSATTAVRRATAWLGAAMTLSATAAAAGFLSFTPTAYKGLADLGVIAGAGMALALAATFTLLPALMGLMHLPVTRPLTKTTRGTPRPGLPAAWISAHARTIAGAALISAGAALIPAMHLAFDFNPLHLLDTNEPAVKTFRDLAKESGTSPYAIEILAPDQAGAEQLAASLRRRNNVARVLTLGSFVPGDQTEKLAIIHDLAMLMPPFTLQVTKAVPSSSAAIAAALTRMVHVLDEYARRHARNPLAPRAGALSRGIRDFLRHSSGDTGALPALEKVLTQGLARQIRMLATALEAEEINIHTLPASLTRRFLAADGPALVKVYSSLDLDDAGNMERFVRQTRLIAPNAGGDPVMMVAGGHAVALAFRQASMLAFVFVAILLAFSLRSARYCTGVLAPLLLAVLLTAAVMELLGIPLNLANVIVAPLLAGLGVSYGIYLALRQRMEGIHGLFASATPRAVLFSALTTLCSFGSLAISGDTAMACLGITLTIALAAVLVCVLIVQPALLSFIPSRQHRMRGEQANRAIPSRERI